MSTQEKVDTILRASGALADRESKMHLYQLLLADRNRSMAIMGEGRKVFGNDRVQSFTWKSESDR